MEFQKRKNKNKNINPSITWRTRGSTRELARNAELRLRLASSLEEEETHNPYEGEAVLRELEKPRKPLKIKKL